jgi:hypothetical protein
MDVADSGRVMSRRSDVALRSRLMAGKLDGNGMAYGGQAHGGATLSPQLSAAASVRKYAGTLPQTGR